MSRTDILNEIIEELWKIRNPHLVNDDGSFQDFKKKILALLAQKSELPPKKIFFELVTARNKNLITIDEQNQLRETVVAFFGLSVGSHAAMTWMMESRADVIKIIDPDTIAPSNLNRIRGGWENIGEYKSDVAKKELLKINPFTKVIAYTNGSTDDIKHVFESTPLPQVVVDEIDSFEAKILLRKYAKKKKIPLVSSADVGDNVIIDIERYDLDPQPEMFLGRIPNVERIKFSKLSDKEKKKLIIKLVGFEENSERMIESLFAIGGSIPTWPQLGATAAIAGGSIATIIKKIILDENIISGRYFISLDDILVKDFNYRKRKKLRTKEIKQMNQLLNK